MGPLTLVYDVMKYKNTDCLLMMLLIRLIMNV